MTPYTVISADSHVTEPPGLWAERFDPALRHRAPRVVREDGKDVLHCEGMPSLVLGRMGVAGKAAEEIGNVGRFDELHRGGWDPDARIKAQDQDGVQAEVVYPTAGLAMYQIADPALQQACFRAYNDWVADHCAAHPARIKGLGLISLLDVEAGIGELRRIKAKNLVGALIAITADAARPYGDPVYQPFWAEAAALGMPVSLHILTNPGKPHIERFLIDYPALPYWTQRTLAALIFGGVLERHPKLRVVSAEADAGWIGTFLQRLDHTARKHGPKYDLRLRELPSHYFHQSVLATFMDDRSALQLWDIIGAASLMWASDYPHNDSTWPHSQQFIARNFRGVPDHAKAKILAANAASLYGFA